MAILFTLKAYARNLLRGNRRRNTFLLFISMSGPEARTLANTLLIRLRQPNCMDNVFQWASINSLCVNPCVEYYTSPFSAYIHWNYNLLNYLYNLNESELPQCYNKIKL